MDFTLNILEALEFFDTKKNGKFSNAIIHLLGEELCAFLFTKYFKEEYSSECKILDFSCKEKGIRGKHLDRWIEIKQSENQITLYQSEIKTWNSNGFNGIELNPNALPSEVNQCGIIRWNQIWDTDSNTGFKIPAINKVLIQMHIPNIYIDIQKSTPLLIHWEPLCNKESSDLKSLIYFSQVVDKNENFKQVCIFSVSIYLRYLFKKGIERIDLPKLHFPLLYNKMKKINTLIQNVI